MAIEVATPTEMNFAYEAYGDATGCLGLGGYGGGAKALTSSHWVILALNLTSYP